MNKFITLSMSLMLSLSGAFAQQNDPEMDAANLNVITVCKNKGGTFISYKDDKCSYSGCAYVGENNQVSYDGNNERLPGCSAADIPKYRSKAKEAYKAEIDKAIADRRAALDKELADLEAKKKNADRIGADKVSGNGDGDGEGDDDGVSGSGKGGGKVTRNPPGGKGAGGYDANGNPTPGGQYDKDGNWVGPGPDPRGGGSVNVGNGGGNGGMSLGSGSMSTVISKNMPCYKQCKKVHTGIFAILTFGLAGKTKEGLERKDCAKCLLGYECGVVSNSNICYNLPSTFRQDYIAKFPDEAGSMGGSYTVGGSIGGKPGKGVMVNGIGVSVGRGGGVGGGGNIGVGGNGNGGMPGSGSGGGSVVIGGPGANGGGAGAGVGGSGNVIIVGGATAGAGGGGNGGVLVEPDFCTDSKKFNFKKCSEWKSLHVSAGGRFDCSVGGNIDRCTGGMSSDYRSESNGGGYCVNCGAGSLSASARPSSNVWDALGGGLGSAIGMIGASAVGGYFNYKSNQAWANSAEATATACLAGNQAMLNYNSSNELGAISPGDYSNLNKSCNGFSVGSFSGFGNSAIGGLLGAGYSPGYLNGYYGPYGAYGGAAYGGGIPGLGGLNGGVIGGGINGGLGYGGVPGINGGLGYGGIPGINGGVGIGLNGGLGLGGLNGGLGYGGLNGGLGYGGLSGGLGYGGIPGMNGGIGLGLGVNGGINPNGMYNGTVPYGVGTGSYYNPMLGYGGAGINGGYGNYGSSYASLMASQQASAIDRMYQQQGSAANINSLAAGMNNYAGYYPSNLGYGAGAGLGISAGFNFGVGY